MALGPRKMSRSIVDGLRAHWRAARGRITLADERVLEAPIADRLRTAQLIAATRHSSAMAPANLGNAIVLLATTIGPERASRLDLVRRSGALSRRNGAQARRPPRPPGADIGFASHLATPHLGSRRARPDLGRGPAAADQRRARRGIDCRQRLHRHVVRRRLRNGDHSGGGARLCPDRGGRPVLGGRVSGARARSYAGSASDLLLRRDPDRRSPLAREKLRRSRRRAGARRTGGAARSAHRPSQPSRLRRIHGGGVRPVASLRRALHPFVDRSRRFQGRERSLGTSGRRSIAASGRRPPLGYAQLARLHRSPGRR